MKLNGYLLCLYSISFKQEKLMKNYLLPLVFATLFTSSVYADSEMKRKDIKTVEDVKEYRATVINKITERLNSGDLTEERANMLEKRIAKLESKPLPTQEQIDWKLANPRDISSMKQKRKIKGFLKKKRQNQLRRNRQIIG
jgi:hypothetical protein